MTARGGRLLRLRTDDQLVALFRLGNDEAFRVIHDRYRTRLLAYTRQMLAGSRSDAEDALQDVFLRAYGTLRANDRPVTLRAWLYRVAHNRCIDHLRRPANQPASELPDNVSSLHDPLAEIQRRDDLRRLVEDVRRLPEQQRSALLMREMEGLTYAELADALAVTVPSVKSLLVRARIGLTESRDARDTACVEIRADVVAAHDKGVRMSGRARRHVRDCAGCTEYRTRLRGVREGLAALSGAPTGWGVLTQLLGLGGASSGAAATAGGGGGAVAGGTFVAGGTAKVAVIVCSVAVVGGGAVEASRELGQRDGRTAAQGAARIAPALPPAGRAPATVTVRATRPTAAARPSRATSTLSPARRKAPTLASGGTDVSRASELRAAPPATVDEPTSFGSSANDDARNAAAAGGMLAPGEASDPEPLTPDPPAEEPLLTVPLLAPTGTTGPG